MANPFRDLIAPSPEVDDVWRWAVVTQTSPILVRFDADDNPFPLSPETVCPVSVGDRVIVHLYQRGLTIMGVAGSVKPFGKLGAAYQAKDTISAGPWVLIGTYGGVEWVTGGVSFNSSKRGLTVPVAGYYRVWGAGSFPPMGDWKRNGLAFAVNGTQTGRSDIRVSMPSYWGDLQVSEYLYLGAGDVVQLMGFSDFTNQEVYNQHLAVEYVRGN